MQKDWNTPPLVTTQHSHSMLMELQRRQTYIKRCIQSTTKQQLFWNKKSKHLRLEFFDKSLFIFIKSVNIVCTH